MFDSFNEISSIFRDASVISSLGCILHPFQTRGSGLQDFNNESIQEFCVDLVNLFQRNLDPSEFQILSEMISEEKRAESLRLSIQKGLLRTFVKKYLDSRLGVGEDSVVTIATRDRKSKLINARLERFINTNPWLTDELDLLKPDVDIEEACKIISAKLPDLANTSDQCYWRSSLPVINGVIAFIVEVNNNPQNHTSTKDFLDKIKID